MAETKQTDRLLTRKKSLFETVDQASQDEVIKSILNGEIIKTDGKLSNKKPALEDLNVKSIKTDGDQINTKPALEDLNVKSIKVDGDPSNTEPALEDLNGEIIKTDGDQINTEPTLDKLNILVGERYADLITSLRGITGHSDRDQKIILEEIKKLEKKI